jgi:hypothetical protein
VPRYPGGSSLVHIYTQIHGTTQLVRIHRTEHNNNNNNKQRTYNIIIKIRNIRIVAKINESQG